jgi:hypothetical protein
LDVVDDVCCAEGFGEVEFASRGGGCDDGCAEGGCDLLPLVVCMYVGDGIRTWMAKQLTPPVPIVNTVLPSSLLSVQEPFHSPSTPSKPRSKPPRIALHAVVPAVTRLAASTALRLVGASTTHSSSTIIYCCSVPSLPQPPNIVSTERLRMSPLIQSLHCRITFVPVLADQMDEEPVEEMMPAPSLPGMRSALWSPGSIELV